MTSFFLKKICGKCDITDCVIQVVLNWKLNYNSVYVMFFVILLVCKVVLHSDLEMGLLNIKRVYF